MYDRLNSKAQEALINLLTVNQLLSKTNDRENIPIVRRAHKGYIRYRQAQGIVDKLMDLVCATIPPEQAPGIIERLKKSEVVVRLKPIYRNAKVNGDDLYICSGDDIVALAEMACTSKCLMCEDPNPKKCELARILEELPIELKNEYGIVICSKRLDL